MGCNISFIPKWNYDIKFIGVISLMIITYRGRNWWGKNKGKIQYVKNHFNCFKVTSIMKRTLAIRTYCGNEWSSECVAADHQITPKNGMIYFLKPDTWCVGWGRCINVRDFNSYRDKLQVKCKEPLKTFTAYKITKFYLKKMWQLMYIVLTWKEPLISGQK